jgi:hypothetical protein
MKSIISIKITYKKKKPVWLWNYILKKFAGKLIPVILVSRSNNSKLVRVPVNILIGIKRSKDVRFIRIRDILFFTLLRFRVGKDAKKEKNKSFYPIVKEMKGVKFN